MIEALGSLKVKSAYLDGELCALNGDGVPVFSRLQAAMDEGRTDQLVFFAFDSGCSGRQSAACATASTLPVTFPAFAHKPASWAWRAPSPSRQIGPMLLAIEGSGLSRSASTARSSLLSAGPIRRAADRTSARCCWDTTPRMGTCTTLAAQAPA